MRKSLEELIRLVKILVRVMAEPDQEKKRNIAQEI